MANCCGHLQDGLVLSIRQNPSIPKYSGLFGAAGWEHRSLYLVRHCSPSRMLPKALTVGTVPLPCLFTAQMKSRECSKYTRPDHLPALTRAAAAGTRGAAGCSGQRVQEKKAVSE